VGPNLSDITRKTIFMGYSYRWLRPLDYVTQPPALLEAVRDNPNRWPGGEGCFALADHDPGRPDDIILFTGGAHTGHFYAVGEVRLSKADPEKPLGWLPRSPLFAEPKYPYDNGFTAEAPPKPISSFADCIFFNGLTRHRGRWWLYYGGSEYYTCLATSPAGPEAPGSRAGRARRRRGER
jgi:hypothetical protein